MDIDTILLDTEDRMEKAMAALERDFQKLRTGRATTALVDGIKADYYGTPTPISQMASVAVPDSRTITIQPWDKGGISVVEKAILKSDVGINPSNDGRVIRLVVPELTEAQVQRSGAEIRAVTRRMFILSAEFSALVALFLFLFSDMLGLAIYKSHAAGHYIRILAPLVPVMYLDTVTDGCLRGLGQQTRCMAINVLDATLGVVLVWVLLPRFGLAGYIFILYFNECVNFTLSFTLLLRTVRRSCTDEKPPAG